MKGFLLDTNVLSELRKGSRANHGLIAWFQTVPEEDLYLSVLVLGEIRTGVERLRRKDSAQARVVEEWLNGLDAMFRDRVLPITAPIAERGGRLNAMGPLSVIDSLIAATALEENLTLVTRNVQDVKRTGVKVLDPFTKPGA